MRNMVNRFFEWLLDLPNWLSLLILAVIGYGLAFVIIGLGYLLWKAV